MLAVISALALSALWFWAARQELTAKKDTVQSARSQFAVSRKRLLKARGSPEEADAQCILTRSRDIYRQSVMLYNQALQKPWNCIPGYLLGFRLISKGDDG